MGPSAQSVSGSISVVCRSCLFWCANRDSKDRSYGLEDGRDEITRKPNTVPRSILVQCAILLLLGGAEGAQPPTSPKALRLMSRHAVRMALKHNPHIQIANLNIALTQENPVVARSALSPEASYEVSETVQRDNPETFMGLRLQGFPQHTGTLWLFQGGARGSVPLFDLAAWHRSRESEENTAGAGAQDLTVREQNVQLVVSHLSPHLAPDNGAREQTAPPPVLTIDDAVATAMQGNRRVRSSVLDVSRASERTADL